jgi:hypothetical protein
VTNGREWVGDGRERQGWVGLVLRWGPVVAWMAGIFFFSAQSRPLGVASEGPYGEVLGRLSHVGEYAVLALLLYRALGDAVGGWRGVGIAFAVAVGYAVTDEVHQRFVPGRECSVMDLGYDALGAAGALLVRRLVLNELGSRLTQRRKDGRTQGLESKRKGAKKRRCKEWES